MKRSIRRWLALGIVPAALAFFGAVAPAHAVIVNDCSNIPNPVPANEFLTVTQASGDCVIDQAIKIDGNIIITVQNGSLTINQDLESSKGAVDLFSGADKDITTRKLTAGNTMKIISGGAISVQGDVVSSFDLMGSGGDGNILIKGQKDVKITGFVVNNGEDPNGSRSGSIQIDANLGDTPDAQNPTPLTPFTIGASSNNGVGGYLDTRSTTAGGNSSSQVSTGIRIQNGVEGSVGDIVVTSLENSDGSDLGNIRVRNSDSRSGWIELIAHKGKITLPSGKLTTRGMNNKGAGNIYLLADTIDVQDGTIINASQNDNAQTTKASQEVILAARRIAIPNGSKGLTINVNGGSPSASLTSNLAITPQGAFTPKSNDQILNLIWQHTINDGFFLYKGEVHIDGAGSAPLSVHVDGSNSRLFITGYPIKFNGGKVTLTSKGDTNHGITIGFFKTDDYDGTQGLSFDNTGKVKISANGENGAGGNVQIQTDKIAFKANATGADPDDPNDDPAFDVVLKANGDTKDGGTVTVFGDSVEIDQLTNAKLAADAAFNGTGNGKTGTTCGTAAVCFVNGAQLQTIDLGTDPGQFKLTARGGNDSGNGGRILVAGGPNTTIKLHTEGAINASATAGDSNGGFVDLLSTMVVDKPLENETVFSEKNLVKAKGTGDGNGGMATAFTAIETDVLRVFDVDTDSLTASIQGVITLNNVTCQQHKSNATGWSRAYWNCSTPSTPSEFDDAVIGVARDDTVLTANLKKNGTRTGAGKVNLFTFNSQTDWQNFFRPVQQGQDFSGATFVVSGTPSADRPNIYSSVFVGVISGSTTEIRKTIIKEVTTHELGHAYDHVVGTSTAAGSIGRDHQSHQGNGPLPQALTQYGRFVWRDFLNLDYSAIGSSAGTSTPRDPCNPTNGITAPFAGYTTTITNQQGQPEVISVCDSNTGKLDARLPFVSDPDNPPLNHFVLRSLDSAGFFLPSVESAFNQNIWRELYPQVFAYEAFVKSQGGGVFAFGVADRLFANGHFACSRAWANDLTKNNITPPTTFAPECDAPIPTWYSF
ncbi:MAG: hypothetical protein KC777_24470 [Cyanobacteria bacterium HKST-UBA02]|nr:hypothetical protein [Cyanobacteria bacterium HKST-UBA02]